MKGCARLKVMLKDAQGRFVLSSLIHNYYLVGNRSNLRAHLLFALADQSASDRFQAELSQRFFYDERGFKTLWEGAEAFM